MAQQMQCEPGLLFPVAEQCADLSSFYHAEGEVVCRYFSFFFLCVSLIWSFLSSFNVFEKEKLPSMLLLHAPYIRWAARTIQWPYSVFSLLTFVHGALVFYEESS